MSRQCTNCGQPIADDDFLCPHCGAVWGDRTYHLTSEPPEAMQEPEVAAPAEAAPEAPQEKPSAPRQPRWVLPVAAICLLLAFGLLFGPELGLWAGEGTTAPSTSSVPDWEGTTTYTVTFVDPYGNPIEGVGIRKLWNNLASSYIPPEKCIYSDSTGTVSFDLYDAFYMRPYVRILSVPEGYSSVMEDVTIYYDEGQTHMQLVLPPSTPVDITIQPTETIPDISVYTVYSATFVDPDGNPVEGVAIENTWNSLSSSLYPGTTYSDSSGTAYLEVWNTLTATPYVRIVSVPEGYSQDLIGMYFYFVKGATDVQIVLDFADDPMPDTVDTYTVYVTDEHGDPVEGVGIINPGISLSTDILWSDEKGQITFLTTPEMAKIEICAVPEGYNQVIVGSIYYFSHGSTKKQIMLQTIDLTVPGPAEYWLKMEDTSMLYGDLPETCQAGKTVTVRVKYDPGVGVMLFANGQEVTDYSLTGEICWKFSFIMPSEPVTLTLRTYEHEDGNEAQEELIRAWYRQFPDGDAVTLWWFYGTYGDVSVGMLHRDVWDPTDRNEKVAGYDFHHISGCMLNVLADGQLISLSEAYNNGWLTDEDVAAIYDLHQIFTSDEPSVSDKPTLVN